MKGMTKARWPLVAGVAGSAALIIIIIASLVSGDRSARDTPANAQSAMADMPGMSVPGAGAVQLTGAQVRQFGVTFGTVEHRILVTELRVPATVVVDETRLAQVALKFGGFVERLHANVTGQLVRRGQVLMDVYSPEVYATMQELLVATRLERASAGHAPIPGATASPQSLVAAARQRLELMGVTADDIDSTLRNDAPSRTITGRSPAGGVVLERRVTQGQAFESAQTLFTIADLSSVWVNGEAREADAAVLRAGTRASVELASMPGRSFAGVVTYVYPTVNPQTRTVTTRVAVTNAGGQFRPGMFATLHLRSPSRRALTVPTSALVRTGERTIVFVELRGGRIEPQQVEAGQSTSAFTEVLTMLVPGQRVVTSAQFLLDSESNLAEVMRSMIGQGAAGLTDMSDMPGMDRGGTPADKGAKVRR